MSEDSFNPRSSDAMFATILAELRGIRESQAEQLTEARKTNGRVTSLEHWRTALKARVALISSAAGAAAALAGWCLDKLLA